MKKRIGNYLKKYLDNSPNPIGLMIVWLTIFFFVCEGLVKLFNIWRFYDKTTESISYIVIVGEVINV